MSPMENCQVILTHAKHVKNSIIQMIKRRHPAHVVTIGMADGIAGKVRLGDIVIADFVYDYKPTKQTPARESQMGQQFPSDRLLYGRALSYQSNEWQNSITHPRLTVPQDSNSTPQEHAFATSITKLQDILGQDTILGVVENTQNGHIQYEKINQEDLHLPIISIAHCRLKDQVESVIGDSIKVKHQVYVAGERQ